jgi:hypothetical protein
MKKNLSIIAKKVGFDKDNFVAFYQQILHETIRVTKILLIGDPDQEEINFWKAVYPTAIVHLMINFRYSELSKETLLEAGNFVYETSESVSILNNFELIIDHGTYKSPEQKEVFQNLFVNNLTIGGLYFFQHLNKQSAVVSVMKNIFDEVPEFSNQIACVSKRSNPKGEKIVKDEIKDGIVKQPKKASVKAVVIENFQVPDTVPVPTDNTINFEEYFASEFVSDKLQKVSGYDYLPIFWTGYKNDLSVDEAKKMLALQAYIKSLPDNKKYFTITQSAIPVDFENKNITIFSMSCSVFKGKKVKVVNIPLIGREHNYNIQVRKDIFASYVGKIDLPLTRELFDMYFRNRDFHFQDKIGLIDEYCFTLARTIFALCPATYGESTFRIWEAIKYSAIPIYITDKQPFLPAFYDPQKPYMLICKLSEIEGVTGNVFKNAVQRNDLLNNALLFREQYYSYPRLIDYIIRYLIGSK